LTCGKQIAVILPLFGRCSLMGAAATEHIASHTSSVQAADNSGNTASKSVTYQVFYRRSGFFQQYPQEGRDFASAMSNISAMVADEVVAQYDVSTYQQIVDVGGSHGTLLAALLRANPAAKSVYQVATTKTRCLSSAVALGA